MLKFLAVACNVLKCSKLNTRPLLVLFTNNLNPNHYTIDNSKCFTVCISYVNTITTPLPPPNQPAG